MNPQSTQTTLDTQIKSINNDESNVYNDTGKASEMEITDIKND